MAKSIRSKRKRELRKIKRVRYAAKELQRLKDMLARAESQKTETKSEPNASFDPDIVTVVSANDIKNGKEKNLNDLTAKTDVTIEECSRPSASVVVTVAEDASEMDHSQRLVYNKNTRRDQQGRFPIWMNQREIKKITGKFANKKRLSRENVGKKNPHVKLRSKKALKHKFRRSEAKMRHKS